MNINMAESIFDTHQAVKNLQYAGAVEKLAEAMVATIKSSIDDRVATKSDVVRLEGKLDTTVSDLKVQLLVWMTIYFGLTIGILKFL